MAHLASGLFNICIIQSKHCSWHPRGRYSLWSAIQGGSAERGPLFDSRTRKGMKKCHFGTKTLTTASDVDHRNSTSEHYIVTFHSGSLQHPVRMKGVHFYWRYMKVTQNGIWETIKGWTSGQGFSVPKSYESPPPPPPLSLPRGVGLPYIRTVCGRFHSVTSQSQEAQACQIPQSLPLCRNKQMS